MKSKKKKAVARSLGFFLSLSLFLLWVVLSLTVSRLHRVNIFWEGVQGTRARMMRGLFGKKGPKRKLFGVALSDVCAERSPHCDVCVSLCVPLSFRSCSRPRSVATSAPRSWRSALPSCRKALVCDHMLTSQSPINPFLMFSHTSTALDTEGIFRLSASTLDIERLKTVYNCLCPPSSLLCQAPLSPRSL